MNRRVSSFFILLLATVASAEEFPFKSGDAEFEKGFGDKKGLTQADKDFVEADRLKIGGTLWNEATFAQVGTGTAANGYFFNPNSLWVYFDARLKGDVRGVMKFKTIFDPTLTDGATNPLTGSTSRRTQTDLEELKILFSANKKVFFTIGKQKIKWGAGKFWNPTDFLNSDRRNFLYSTDLRSGISQVKTHVPLGASNLYMIQGLDQADKIDKVRHSLRAEVPLGGKGEISASTSFKKESHPRYGIDVSSAVGDFDVYGEAAYVGTSSWVLGVSYDAVYAESDTITFGLEYFENGAGYSSTSDYTAVFTSGAYQPFYLSRRYGMFMVYLPKPGNWNHTTFTIFNLLNLSDYSALTRVEALFTAMDDLSINVAVGAHYGNGDGEFKIGGQNLDASVRLMLDF
ncbi:hypothetical protein K2X30_04485 [bacterium]|nr:hypothetical protein [bacterium]